MSLQETGPSERKLAACAHLLPLLGLVLPGGNLLGPGLLFLTVKSRSVFVRAHAAESFNFQITVTSGMLLLWLVAFGLVVIKLGFLIQWISQWYQDPSMFSWPAWPQIGSWALLALGAAALSVILAVVLWVWNLIEIARSCLNALKGKVSCYSFIFRPLEPRWNLKDSSEILKK